jgi:hypothetical protein
VPEFIFSKRTVAGKKMPTLIKIDKKIRPAREANEARLRMATSARSTTIAVAMRRAMAAVQVEIWSTWICEPLITEDYVGRPRVIRRQAVSARGLARWL